MHKPARSAASAGLCPRLGHGMWGLAGWSGSDDDETAEALHAAVAAGVTFFDTAWGYGRGKSERILATSCARAPRTPAVHGIQDSTPNLGMAVTPWLHARRLLSADHIREYTEKSLENLGLPRLDLMQFHVWGRRPGARRAVSSARWTTSSARGSSTRSA